MSLRFRNNQGVETPVAGLNGTSGELVPSVALQQSGTVNFSCSENTWTTVDVTFTTPMPDTDYLVNTDSGETAYVHVQVATTKRTTGFTMIIWNRDAVSNTGIIRWTAFKLMTDTIHEADAAHIAQNTANFAPAFSEVTSYAVGDYCTYNNVLYRCTTAHTAGVWVAGHFTQVTVGGTLGDIVSNAYNPSSYGGYTTGTKTWWKISNLFVAGSDFTYRTNVFMLSSREGSGTALLTIGDNGSNIRSAKIIMLNGTLNGVGDFYFNASTSSLYYSMQWSRLQIVQLSGQKIDIGEAIQSSSSEATQYTAITPIITADINLVNEMFGTVSDTSSITVHAPNYYAIKNYVVTIYTSEGLYAASLYIRPATSNPDIFEIVKSEVVETHGSPAPAPSFAVSRASSNSITISVSNVSNLTSLIVSY